MEETLEAMGQAGREYGKRLADQVADYVNARVELALALERDRYEDALNSMARALAAMGERIDLLESGRTRDRALHSLRADLLP